VTLCFFHDIQGYFGECVIVGIGVVEVFYVVMMKSSRKYRNPNQKSFQISLRRVWFGGDGRDVWAWI
jgi:hypothetical protein